MTGIVLEREKLRSIVKDIETLIESGQEIKSDNYKNLAKQNDGFLTEKEKRILAYIKKNEGCSKQDVVRYFVDEKNKYRYSRVPVFHGIENLVRYKIIIVKEDDKNSQIHRLYVNKESLIISIQGEMELMQEFLWKLMSKSTLISKQLQKNIQANTHDTTEVIESFEFDSDTTSFVLQIFNHLLSTYASYATFKWPQQIKDTEVLNRLYLVVFQKLREILDDIQKFVPFDAEQHKRQRYLQNYMKFYPDEFKDMILHFRKYQLDDELDSLMATIWKMDDSIIPKGMPKEWKMASKIIEDLNPR